MLKRENIHIRDPFVYMEAGQYYLLGTTGDNSWDRGSDLMLYASADLENFAELGPMVSGDTLAGYTNIWAPELHRYENKYYLIVSVFRKDLGRGSMILTADGLTGPFLPLTGSYITPAGWGCLDASLFAWKGRPYLYFSNEWTTPVAGDGDGALYVAELTKDLKALAGAPVCIVSGKGCGIATEIQHAGYRGYVAEGPYALEEKGKITLYWSTFTQGGYSIIKSTAQDIFGPYVYEETVFAKDGGHCMVFTDRDGRKQMTFHQPNTGSLERMRLFALEAE